LESGEPISGARVILTRLVVNSANATALPSATTDGQGKFLLKNLDAGDYRVTFAASGFAKQDFGQRSFSGQGSPIALAAGQTLKDQHCDDPRGKCKWAYSG
jgi:5-hydroxyisourate hydrolase-like protein (transthyretin family)